MGRLPDAHQAGAPRLVRPAGGQAPAGAGQRLPYDPLADETLLRAALASGEGVQFSHSVEEQIGGQLRAGFRLTDLYEDTTGYGVLQEYRVPTFLATRCVKDA